MAKKESKELAKAESAKGFSPIEEFERRFEDFFRRPFPFFGPPWWLRLKTPEMEEIAPSVDMFRDGDDVVVHVELPGLKKEDIEVNLSENTLTITGEKKKEKKIEKKDYYRMESSFGSFARSISLPPDVQTDKARAQFRDGVLEIRLPRTEEARRKAKKVTIE
jgi:HSP20 family protein